MFRHSPRVPAWRRGEGSQGLAGSGGAGRDPRPSRCKAPVGMPWAVQLTEVPGSSLLGRRGTRWEQGRGRFSLGAGGTEGAPPQTPSSPSRSCQAWGEAGERLAEDTDCGVSLGDRSTPAVHCPPSSGEGCRESCPPGPRWPWTRWGQPCLWPRCPSAWAQAGDPSLLLQPQRWGRGGGSEVLNGRKPVGKQAEAQPGPQRRHPRAEKSEPARDLPLLCTGEEALVKPCTMNVFLWKPPAEVGQGQGGCAQPWPHQVLGVWGRGTDTDTRCHLFQSPWRSGGGPGGHGGPAEACTSSPQAPAHRPVHRSGPLGPAYPREGEVFLRPGPGEQALRLWALMSALATRALDSIIAVEGSGVSKAECRRGCGGQRECAALPEATAQVGFLCLGPIRGTELWRAGSSSGAWPKGPYLGA